MTTRLPFTLTPLPDEPFGVWWHAYATKLGVTRTELTRAAGIPTGVTPGPEHSTAIATATGLRGTDIAGMFHTVRPCPPEHVLRAWTPQQVSRFCLHCLACLAEGASWPPAWRLPLTFFCLGHNTPLTERCPACGQPPPGGRAPTALTRACPSCGHDLATTNGQHTHPGDAATDAATDEATAAATATAQEHINSLLARLRDPAEPATGREQAQDNLTDLVLIALHLSQDTVQRRRGFTTQMPDRSAFTDAITLLTEPNRRATRDRLADLVTQRFAGPQTRAIPFSWRAASPALITRIARTRDAAITPIERIRYATTLPRVARRRRQSSDPALARAQRLPDQLWPVWAIRLTNDDALDGPVFRSATIAALLLPHSDLPLNELTPLLPHQPDPDQLAHQLRRLAATPDGGTALRILTELGLALDHHDIPIDYPRRRRLVTDTDLIDKPTWNRYCRDAGLRSGGPRRLGLARRYLYELLTGGNLTTATEPYRLPEQAPRADYVEFCATLPAPLATTLTTHAEQLLTAAGITGEPLSWHPPADWVTDTDWPGVDPESTDPGPIHSALRAHWAATPHNHWAPPQAVADALGISSQHLRHILHLHPIDRAPYRQHRAGAVIAMPADDSATGHRADPDPNDPRRVFLVNLDWLHEQYTTWGRSIVDIATEIGCRKATLRAFAETHGIPRRPRSGGNSCIATGTITGHPADLPDLLRKSLTGQRSRARLERFLAMTAYPSLNQAAIGLGVHQSTLTTQLQIIERACGGPLLQRPPKPWPIGPLTPLGEQLCQQAHDHLNLTPNA
jgi:hypothetical protein